MTIRAALAVTLLLGACADQAAVAPPVAVTPAPETNVNLKDTLFPSSWIAIDLAGTTADVAVHDDEHGWRYVIDDPFGTA